HSMGGAIASLFLQRHRVGCDAIALSAPMFCIVIRLPSFMVRHILDWGEGHQRSREDYGVGSGLWRAGRGGRTALTHSRQR
ncbi:serine aminopeptidase domain-containing protein, partial [Salmonella enterica subsp. enterica serovar Infantis]